MKDDLIELLWEGLRETLYMVFWSSIFALALGLVLGIALVVTDKDGIRPISAVHRLTGFIINVVRSMPYIILIVLLIPIARWIVGTSLGPTAAIVSLSIAAAPFLGRMIENSLKEVGGGKIEAAKSVGASSLAIVWRVLLPEALPALIRSMTIAVIAITEFTAVAGAIGAGGLGSLAIRFGYQRFREDVLFATVFIILALVQTIQWSGNAAAKSIERKRFKLK